MPVILSEHGGRLSLLDEAGEFSLEASTLADFLFAVDFAGNFPLDEERLVAVGGRRLAEDGDGDFVADEAGILTVPGGLVADIVDWDDLVDMAANYVRRIPIDSIEERAKYTQMRDLLQIGDDGQTNISAGVRRNLAEMMADMLELSSVIVDPAISEKISAAQLGKLRRSRKIMTGDKKKRNKAERKKYRMSASLRLHKKKARKKLQQRGRFRKAENDDAQAEGRISDTAVLGFAENVGGAYFVASYHAVDDSTFDERPQPKAKAKAVQESTTDFGVALASRSLQALTEQRASSSP